MTINPVFTNAKPLTAHDAQQQFRHDVTTGLSAPQKFLSAKYFYDAVGSELFELITHQPEYYPTRTELDILERKGPEIAAHIPHNGNLVEFGSGSTAKVRRLLVHRPDLAGYVPVDVSETFLHREAQALATDFPNLVITPVAADFTRAFTLPDRLLNNTVAGFFPGSTIGNFEPAQAKYLLAHFGRVLGRGATLIVGVDLVKDQATLNAAYNDIAGVTAAFNRNLLVRIKDDLGATVNVDGFFHRAHFNETASRIEMHLVSRFAQTIRLDDHTFTFVEGDTIHTENSYKYTLEGFRSLALEAGWTTKATWTDEKGLFSVHSLLLS